MNQAETLIPGRTKLFDKTPRPTPARQKAILSRELAPSRDEYHAIIQALWVGDDNMDAPNKLDV